MHNQPLFHNPGLRRHQMYTSFWFAAETWNLVDIFNKIVIPANGHECPGKVYELA